MADRTYLDLESVISPSAPGCPPPTIEQYVRRAAIQACERTLAWRYEMDPLSTATGTYEYAYDTPAFTEVCGVIHAARDGCTLPIKTQEWIHEMYPAWPDTTSTSRAQPLYMLQYNPDSFLLAPVPDDNVAANYSIKLFLALRPTPDSTYMDKTIFDELEVVITHLALKDLLSIPNKSWTDTKEAGRNAQEAAYRLSARRAKANLGVGRATLSARMQPFA